MMASNGFADIVRGIADLLGAIAWPLTVLVVLYVLFLTDRGRQALNAFLARVRRVKGPHFELELSEQAASQTREFTEERFREFRRLVASEFDRQVTVFSIDERHQRIIADHIIPTLRSDRDDERPTFRCTLHVSDILFTQALYQLLDYYGDAPGKKGRAFSVRFGIVGRAWRLGEPQVEDNVSTVPEDLVRDWGMTWNETGAGRGKHSFAAIPLQDQHRIRVGVVYLDSEDKNAFGATRGEERTPDERAQALFESVTNGAEATGLTAALGLMMAELRKRGPAIRVFEVGE